MPSLHRTIHWLEFPARPEEHLSDTVRQKEIRDCGCEVTDSEVVVWCVNHRQWAEDHGKLELANRNGAEIARGLIPGRHLASGR